METPHDPSLGATGPAPPDPAPIATAPPAGPVPVLVPASRTWTQWHTAALAVITVVVIGAGLLIPSAAQAQHGQPSPRLWSWLETLILLAAFVTIAGHGITGLWRGALIDDRNKMSLSRLQMIVWTIVVLSGFLAAALDNIRAGPTNSPLGIAIPAELWALMGITTTALLGSPLILSTKKARPANPQQARETLARLGAAPVPAGAPAQAPGVAAHSRQVTHQGQVLVNVRPEDAQWSDLFLGEETGNGANLDLGKIQMFYFTLIVALAYAVALGALFAGGTVPIRAFPALDASMVALLGISNGGYLANKAIPHSQTPLPPSR